ncbi:WXG100 family type VII secretion target [Segniliparus rotundus]|nr:WXG100 family type VII secretion target [Segniliparus rotundus]
MGEEYRVELDQLLAHVERCEEFDKKVEDWLDQIDAAIARLHTSWSGEAAAAQREQHDRWVAGAREMRDALARLKDQAAADHGRYAGLIGHQRGMWP